MDYEWAQGRLIDFKDLCDRYQVEDSLSDRYTEAQRALNEAITTNIPTIREITRRLDPALVDLVTEPAYLGGASDSLRAVHQALGILRDRLEWVEHLQPDSPTLIADRMHPKIWAAAAVLWGTGEYRVAVQQAAVTLSTQIQVRVESHLTDRALVANAFSPKRPDSGQSRLHFPGDTSTDTWKSRQEGLHHLAQGAFAGIRNVAAHTDEKWTEQVSLERLAVFSTVARWADETEVVTGA